MLRGADAEAVLMSVLEGQHLRLASRLSFQVYDAAPASSSSSFSPRLGTSAVQCVHTAPPVSGRQFGTRPQSQPLQRTGAASRAILSAHPPAVASVTYLRVQPRPLHVRNPVQSGVLGELSYLTPSGAELCSKRSSNVD